eukprot:SAG31_NODE_47382_length_246_cov_6.646259_1_plen_39_part_01
MYSSTAVPVDLPGYERPVQLYVLVLEGRRCSRFKIQLRP